MWESGNGEMKVPEEDLLKEEAHREAAAKSAAAAEAVMGNHQMLGMDDDAMMALCTAYKMDKSAITAVQEKLVDGIKAAYDYRLELERQRGDELTNEVEMFGLTTGDLSASTALLREILGLQIQLLSKLELHFRVLQMPSQELGAPAYEKFDCEAWFPGRNSWGELSSASNCADFQSRRLPIAYTDKDGNGRYAHTVNGTAAASTRLLLAVVETHQRPSPTGNTAKVILDIPEVLKPFIPQLPEPTAPLKSRSINPRNFI